MRGGRSQDATRLRSESAARLARGAGLPSQPLYYHRCRLLAHAPRAELALDAQAIRRAKFRAQGWLRHEPQDSVSQSPVVPRRREELVPARPDGIADAGDVRRRQRQPGGHTLQDAVRAAFGARAEHAEVSRAQKARHVLHLPQETYAPAEFQVVREGLRSVVGAVGAVQTTGEQ